MLALSRKAGEEIVLLDHGVMMGVVALCCKTGRTEITAPSRICASRQQVPRRAFDATREYPESSREKPDDIHVLVADTDSQLLASYSKSLSGMGFSVTTAKSGLECLSQLFTHPPDLLVLDPELPLGGGYGVTAMIREDHDVPLVPVLIHTLDHDQGIRRDILFPVVGHERKPLSPDRLAECIRRLVRDFRHQLPCT